MKVLKKLTLIFLVSLIGFGDMNAYYQDRKSDAFEDTCEKVALQLAVYVALFGAIKIGSMISDYYQYPLVTGIEERFSSVAGNYEAKSSLEEVVDFFKNPEKYEKCGTKIPKGVLMYGPPGTGKTLLARAVAGEANCSFIHVNASEFTDMYLGGAEAKIISLFNKARWSGPCIVFIDEIDAVGKKRGFGTNSIQDNVLNQLLTEMDGFSQNKKPVVVIAATNRKDVLDDALLRSGRFDRHVYVGAPTLLARKEILEIYLNQIEKSDDINIDRIAKGTPGFVGADLKNLVNEAAFLAVRNDSDVVTMQHFEDALDKIMLGSESLDMNISEQEKEIVAYHESGHALVRLLMPHDTDPLHKITISPRGGSLGAAYCLPEREEYLIAKSKMMASIAVALGGRAAEEIMFDSITQGAQSDLQVATTIARDMVCSYGMTDALGKRVFFDHENISSQTQMMIDTEIIKILDEQYQFVMQLLRDNKDKLDKMAKLLLEKNTVYAAELYELLDIEPRQDLRLYK